ncbi:MAG: M15 family metallopeptidase [Alistipes sp.]|nr:M15 family metallopeptidase [Alistipes sp.]
MKSYNMVDITTLDSSILVELKYSTTDNFVGVDMYRDLERAYLEKEFAQKVVLAQSILKREHPNLTLLIYDAARPISAQRAMRRCVEGSELESFVADGTRGGRHNYGVAVDLTIATEDGTPLDMGAEFDEFSEASSVKGSPDTSDKSSRTIDVYRGYITELANRGIITYEAARNRILLVEVMCEAGLYPYRKEWWHYEDIMPMSSVRSKYRLLDF